MMKTVVLGVVHWELFVIMESVDVNLDMMLDMGIVGKTIMTSMIIIGMIANSLVSIHISLVQTKMFAKKLT